MLHRRPSELLGLTGKHAVWLLEFDWQLLKREAERLEQDAEESASEKAKKMREWFKRRHKP